MSNHEKYICYFFSFIKVFVITGKFSLGLEDYWKNQKTAPGKNHLRRIFATENAFYFKIRTRLLKNIVSKEIITKQ